MKLRGLSRMMKALGDETRLRIVALLSHGELCVCHIEGALGLTQPTASRHLSVLRAAGVVDDQRKGTWVYYTMADQLDPDCKSVLRALVGSFAKRDVLKRDVERLLKTRGPNACK